MRIYFQWDITIPWSQSAEIAHALDHTRVVASEDTTYLPEKVLSYQHVRDKVDQHNIWVLPLYDQYANPYNEQIIQFLMYPHKIIGISRLTYWYSLAWLHTNKDLISTIYTDKKWMTCTRDFIEEQWLQTHIHSSVFDISTSIKQLNQQSYGLICKDFIVSHCWLQTILTILPKEKLISQDYMIIAHGTSTITMQMANSTMIILFVPKNEPSSMYDCIHSFASLDIKIDRIDMIPYQKIYKKFACLITIENPSSMTECMIAYDNLKKYAEESRIVWSR